MLRHLCMTKRLFIPESLKAALGILQFSRKQFCSQVTRTIVAQVQLLQAEGVGCECWSQRSASFLTYPAAWQTTKAKNSRQRINCMSKRPQSLKALKLKKTNKTKTQQSDGPLWASKLRDMLFIDSSCICSFDVFSYIIAYVAILSECWFLLFRNTAAPQSVCKYNCEMRLQQRVKRPLHWEDTGSPEPDYMLYLKGKWLIYTTEPCPQKVTQMWSWIQELGKNDHFIALNTRQLIALLSTSS